MRSRSNLTFFAVTVGVLFALSTNPVAAEDLSITVDPWESYQYSDEYVLPYYENYSYPSYYYDSYPRSGFYGGWGWGWGGGWNDHHRWDGGHHHDHHSHQHHGGKHHGGKHHGGGHHGGGHHR